MQSELTVTLKYEDSSFKKSFNMYHDAYLPTENEIEDCIKETICACKDTNPNEVKLKIIKVL